MTAAPLSVVAGTPVVCAYTSLSTGSRDAAGFWDGSTITLSPAVCSGLAGIRLRVVTEASMQAVVVLSHEMAHASGRDLTMAAAMASDPGFIAETTRVENSYGLSPASAAREAGADCAGARRASAVAYALGLRQRSWFLVLHVLALAGTYTAVPAECL